jgi:hypothetical protein
MFNGLRLLVILRHIPTVIIDYSLALIVLYVDELRRRAIDYVMMHGMILCSHVSLLDLVEPLELGLSEDLTRLELQLCHHHILPRLFISHDYCTVRRARCV